MPLAEKLLLQLRTVIQQETSSEGEGALAGNLQPEQISVALWLFVRHLPSLQQTNPHSPLLQMLPPLIEELLLLVGDLDSLSSEQLCDMMNVLARLQRPNTQLVPRMVAQIEGRLSRNQLRLAQVIETAWAIFELNGSLQGELTQRLLNEIDRRAHTEGPDQVRDGLRLLGSLPMRRPWPLLEPLATELRTMCGGAMILDPQLLTDVIDGLARLRFDDLKLLDAIESQIERSLEGSRLHEAQTCTIVESLGCLSYRGRSDSLTGKLLDRLKGVESLLPHSAVALLHGLALLKTEPSAPLGIADILRTMNASGLPIDLSEASLLLWSLVELGCSEPALEMARSLPEEIADSASSVDLHTLTMCLWALLTLRCYDQGITAKLLAAINMAAAGVSMPAHLCRLAECMLMLQLEAPQELSAQFPSGLRYKAQHAWQQAMQHQQREPISQQLREVSEALEALKLPHQVNVFNTYLIDALIPHEVTNGPTFAILLHPSSHYTSTGQLLGSLQLKKRLLQALGCIVIHIQHSNWNDHRTDEMRQCALRDMLKAHMNPQAHAQAQPAAGAGGAAAQPADPRASAGIGDPRAAMAESGDPRAGGGGDPRAGGGGGDPRAIAADPRAGGDPRAKGDPRAMLGDPRAGM